MPKLPIILTSPNTSPPENLNFDKIIGLDSEFGYSALFVAYPGSPENARKLNDKNAANIQETSSPHLEPPPMLLHQKPEYSWQELGKLGKLLHNSRHNVLDSCVQQQFCEFTINLRASKSLIANFIVSCIV